MKKERVVFLVSIIIIVLLAFNAQAGILDSIQRICLIKPHLVSNSLSGEFRQINELQAMQLSMTQSPKFPITGKNIFTGKATSQQINVSIVITSENTAPTLENINSPILACESSSLSYLFNATDSLNNILAFSINSPDPFYVQTYSSTSNSNNVIYIGELYSILLTKSHAGNNYSRTISVTDGSLSDNKQVNISVIEINNAPSMATIGDKSVSLDNSENFYYKVNVTDTEDGNQDSGNFSFNLSFTSGDALFDINSLGVMNYNATSSNIGSYNLRVCASDLGIPVSRRHANISLCGQTGENQSDCENFVLTISQAVSSPSSSSVSSSGGGAGISCEPKWGCKDWGICQNAYSSLQSGILSGEEYRIAEAYCILNDWADEETCGFQYRECLDVNSCNNNLTLPLQLQACYYTENPSCSDGIKNCHDGSCEFLVDCGGTCNACPTCSDGRQNQGEEGIDCGGPCPNGCITFTSPKKENIFDILKDIDKTKAALISLFNVLKSIDKTKAALIGLILSVSVILFIVLAIKLKRVIKLQRIT